MTASRCLALAASPVFALMMLAGLVSEDGAARLCSPIDSGPFGGMTVMYPLMSGSHAAP